MGDGSGLVSGKWLDGIAMHGARDTVGVGIDEDGEGSLGNLLREFGSELLAFDEFDVSCGDDRLEFFGGLPAETIVAAKGVTETDDDDVGHDYYLGEVRSAAPSGLVLVGGVTHRLRGG